MTMGMRTEDSEGVVEVIIKEEVDIKEEGSKIEVDIKIMEIVGEIKEVDTVEERELGTVIMRKMTKIIIRIMVIKIGVDKEMIMAIIRREVDINHKVVNKNIVRISDPEHLLVSKGQMRQ